MEGEKGENKQGNPFPVVLKKTPETTSALCNGDILQSDSGLQLWNSKGNRIDLEGMSG